MSIQIATASDVAKPARGSWGAVAALTLCVSTLIASEFMPVSLLTPIAADLHITEGQAGQAIAISGLFAVLTSLVIASATRKIDRKHVLLALTGVMIVSGLMVALAPNCAVFMAGRALRRRGHRRLLVDVGRHRHASCPGDQVPRALGVLNGGNALATTIAAPLGSFLGQYIGWRGAFFVVVPLAAIALAWQHLSLPAMPPQATPRTGSVFRVLRRPGVQLGFVAVGLFFTGQFALFTYLRPFLETVTGVSVSGLSLILLGLGLAGLLGTWLIGRMLPAHLALLLVVAPLALAVISAALIAVGAAPLPTAVLLAAWGLVGTAAPVAWWTWISKTLPDDAEAGGGLMVAVIQLSITLGASVGGLLVDASGYAAAFLAAAVILLASAALMAAGGGSKA